jgi:hypothetical protein
MRRTYLKLLSATPRLLLPLWLCLPWTAVHAGVIYSNLGPDGSFSAPGPVGAFIAFDTEFVATGGGSLQAVLLPLAYLGVPGGPPGPPIPELLLGLYTGASGKPGTELESWADFNVPAISPALQLLTFESVLHPTLTAGTEYWFLVISETGTVLWGSSPEIASGGFWTGLPGGPMTQILPQTAPPAIELESVASTSAPEPQTWLLMPAGLLAFFIRRKPRSLG